MKVKFCRYGEYHDNLLEVENKIGFFHILLPYASERKLVVSVQIYPESGRISFYFPGLTVEGNEKAAEELNQLIAEQP